MLQNKNYWHVSCDSHPICSEEKTLYDMSGHNKTVSMPFAWKIASKEGWTCRNNPLKDPIKCPKCSIQWIAKQAAKEKEKECPPKTEMVETKHQKKQKKEKKKRGKNSFTS